MVHSPRTNDKYLLECDFYKLAIRDVPKAVLWFDLVMQLTIKHRDLPLHAGLHSCKGGGQLNFLFQLFRYKAQDPCT